jgi:hypothetical protein
MNAVPDELDLYADRIRRDRHGESEALGLVRLQVPHVLYLGGGLPGPRAFVAPESRGQFFGPDARTQLAAKRPTIVGRRGMGVVQRRPTAHHDHAQRHSALFDRRSDADLADPRS